MSSSANTAARRERINNDVRTLRSRRDDNILESRRFMRQIDELDSVIPRLENCINDQIQIERQVERCHNVVPTSAFAGRRRRQTDRRLENSCERVKREIRRHQQNLERLRTVRNNLQGRLDTLQLNIQNQNQRIDTLVADLRNL